MAGIVVGLRVPTLGGVIAPGEPLLDIVPSGDRLVVEARVDPQDIDSVRPGLEAQVRITALSQRHLLPLQGKVIAVSADRLTDARSGAAYYLARIELPGDPGSRVDGVVLHPGVQADVMLLTGERTVLDDVMRPLTRTFDRAFKEA